MLTKELNTSPVVQPCFIEPMQAAPVRKLPDGRVWTYEAKLDGYRSLVAKFVGRVVLWSRRGNAFTARFPEIARACEKLPADTVIDGEVVAIDESGKISFNALQHSRPRTHVQFYAFDVLVHRGRNILGLPLESRRELLLEVLAKTEYPLLGSQAFDGKPAELTAQQRNWSLRASLLNAKGLSTSRVGAVALG